MHLTLKRETTKPAVDNFQQQQARSDDFVEEFNTERPHQALAMAACPAQRTKPRSAPIMACRTSIIRSTTRRSPSPTCGRTCYKRKKINLSLVFAGQAVGIKQDEDHIWLASVMDYDLGYFDDETSRLEPLPNPFGPKVLPMSQE